MDAATGTWKGATISGHDCQIYEPPQLNEHGYVVVYLHGVHQHLLHNEQPFLDQFDRHGLRVVCPITQRSWWTDRVCDEFDPKISAEHYVMEHVLPYVAENFGVGAPSVALLGTSMGGQGALRLAFKYPNRFPIVAAISPAIDYHTRWDEGDETLPQMYPDQEAARQDTATLHVHPLNWPRNIWFCCDPSDRRWIDSAERLRMKLAALGIPHQCELETEAGGHSFSYYNCMAESAVQFLVERLDKERRRVV